MTVAWRDGRFVDDRDLAAALAGPGGLFETLGARGGALPLWPRHLERLRASAAAVGLPASVPRGLAAAAAQLLARNGHRDDILRITLTAGASGSPSWLLTSRPRQHLAHVRLHPVVVSARDREPLARVKTTTRHLYARALAEAERAGADDALLVDEHGRVLETTTANVFALDAGLIRTPPLSAGVLPGIARAVLLERLAARGTPALEQDLTLSALRRHTLAVTNAVYGPRPAALPGGFPGSIDPLPELWPPPSDLSSAPPSGR